MMKSTNPPAPPFGLRPRAVSLRAGGPYEPEADPEGKGRLGGILLINVIIIPRLLI